MLHQHPAVAAVAVVGLPDEDLGEIVGAIVQVRAAATAAELTAIAAARLDHFQVPARWRLQQESLPMTDAGKIAKHALRDAWLAQTAPSPAAPGRQDDPGRRARTS